MISIIDTLYSQGVKKFETWQKGSSIKVQLESGATFSQSSANHVLKKNEIWILKKFEKMAVDHKERYSPKIDYPYIQASSYFNHNMIVEDVVQLDIEAAYWRTAKLLGIINDDEFYLKGKPHKLARNISIGRLASETHHGLHYEGEYQPLSTIPPIRKDVYAEICRRCSNSMTYAMKLKKSALFFWVDAIFVLAEDADFYKKEFEDLGYKVHEKGRYKSIYRAGNRIFITGSSKSYNFSEHNYHFYHGRKQ